VKNVKQKKNFSQKFRINRNSVQNKIGNAVLLNSAEYSEFFAKQYSLNEVYAEVEKNRNQRRRNFVNFLARVDVGRKLCSCWQHYPPFIFTISAISSFGLSGSRDPTQRE
jgi:hypothetical protein